jgi:hypothetical protein
MHSLQLIEMAVSRIKHIDYKTVSIVFFEHTILGVYTQEKEYKVEYPPATQ